VYDDAETFIAYFIELSTRFNLICELLHCSIVGVDNSQEMIFRLLKIKNLILSNRESK
jgi:hypothetical protein